jgi:hypothetical protein
VSFDIFFQSLGTPEGVPARGRSILDVIRPLIVECNGAWARIETVDGSADVYGLDDSSSGLMINHASGRAVWDLMYDIARAGAFAVMPVGCGTCVLEGSFATALAVGMPEPIVMVRSGADLLTAVGAA